MKFAVYAPNCWGYGSPRVLLQLAECAERSGWDGFFIWDHLLMGHEDAVADAQVALAAIAARTESVHIGALLTPLARRRPWKVARELASLECLAPGRVVLGVGLGMTADFSPFSSELQFDRQRAVALDDGIELVRELLSGQAVSWVQDTARQHELGDELPLRVEAPAFVPAPSQPIRVWGGARIQRNEARPQARRPFLRAAKLDGLFPVASDWNPDQPLSVHELRTAIQLAFGPGRQRPPAGFDLLTCGRTSSQQTVSLAGYREVGVTWWLETLPDNASVDEALEIIRSGPPSE